jgi:hydroxyacylglutathione hydrolase
VTHAKVLAHTAAASRIGGVDRGLKKGDIIRVGRTVELECLDTPGHTMAHICLLGHADQPALFSGDTLFNAGAGNCHGGGHPEALYETFASQLARLPDDTRIFPGHEYLARNLEFTLDREPGNADAQALLARARNDAPEKAVVTTLGEEKRVNTFFRLQNPTVIARLREAFTDIGERPDARTVFVKLRELRNRW